MFTISDIIADVNRGCTAHNMVEDCFSYRIVFFVNEEDKGSRFYADTPYSGLRKSLENIIRGNLSTTNTIVLAAVTARKNGQTVSLLNRSYSFSLDEFFRQINGEYKGNIRSRNTVQSRYAVR